MNASSSETALVSQAEFRAACALFPTGVTVVTRMMDDSRPYGMTVSSFTSVSLEPPLVLVCIDRRAGFLADLSHSLPFAVNVLRDDQENLATRFSKPPEGDRFAGLPWSRGYRDVPLLEGTVASFACVTVHLMTAGDHVVVVGRVEALRRHAGRALVWCESGYQCLPAPRLSRL